MVDNPDPVQYLKEKFDTEHVGATARGTNIMNAIVLFKGKDWANYNKDGFETSAKFKLEDDTEVSVKAKDVGSSDAEFLRGLTVGQSVPLVSKQVRNPKTDQWVPKYSIDFATLLMVYVAGGASSGPPVKPGFNDQFAKVLKRTLWFQEQGLKLAHELANTSAFGDPLDISDNEIFQRGGAIGTSMQITMERKGL